MSVVLKLVLTRDWFDKIESGEKKIEYREHKEFWDKKFNNSFYPYVRFQRAFDKRPKTMLFKVNQISLTKTPEEVKEIVKTPIAWAIELGERIK